MSGLGQQTVGVWLGGRRAMAAVAMVAVLSLMGAEAQATETDPEPSLQPTPGEVVVDLPDATENGQGVVPEAVTEGHAAEDEGDRGPDLGSGSGTDADVPVWGDLLDGFGDIPADAVVSVPGQALNVDGIDDSEQVEGAPDLVVQIEPAWDVLAVGVEADEPDGVVTALHAVSLGEAYSSASSGITSSLPQPARGDLFAAQFPRASVGDEFNVETIPVDDAGVAGAAFGVRVTSVDAMDDAQWVGLELDVSGIRYAHGGDFGGRLSLMVFPECILVTPEVPECTVGVPVSSINEDGETLTGVVPADAGDGIRLEGTGGMAGVRSTAVRATDLMSSVGMNVSTGQGSIVMAVSGVAGPAGTFAKTDLKPTGEWGVGGATGAFTYAVPLEVPPVATGPVPDVTLSYNSAVIDGHTPASNGQSSWVGDGWDLSQSFIERQYNSCTVEGVTGKGNDLCWSRAFDPATYRVGGAAVTLSAAEQASYVMSLGGATYQLFPQGNNLWMTSPDSGIVVERKLRGASTNGDDDGEYFRVWLPDGSVAYFGYGHNGAGGAVTNSVATVQAWGNDGGPSCTGSCQQAYRWMLDIEVDAAKNASLYLYAKDTNKYAQSGTAVYNSYTSAIYPYQIWYGGYFSGTWDVPKVDAATAKIDFVRTGRCVGNTVADHSRAAVSGGVMGGCATPSASVAGSFPDVPTDLICTGSTCNLTTQRTPAFFSQYRLARVDTAVLVNGAWSAVASHTLYATYPLPAGADGRTLWLDGVFTRYLGQDKVSVADDLVTYAITFDGTLLNNRVDWTTAAGQLKKRRLSGIRNQFGGYVKVSYNRQATPGTTGGACPTTTRSTPTPQDGLASTWYRSNGWECVRVKAADGAYGLYHRYLVSSVDLVDVVAGQPTQTFTYTYGHTATSAPLWAYADSILLSRNASNVDAQDFSTFLGYPVVTVATGSGSTASSTTTYYYQGRQGTWDGANTVTATLDLPGAWADPADYAMLRGRPVLEIAKGASGQVISETRTTYATLLQTDGPYAHDAVVVQTPLVTSVVSTPSGSRTSTTSSTYDAVNKHLVTQTVSVPDTATPGVNVSRSTTRYTPADTAYAGKHTFNRTAPAPFFQLPVGGASYLNPGSGEVLTGEWETSYLEAGGVMRGMPVKERQRVAQGSGVGSWLESTATYDSRGRIVTAKGPAESSNGTQVSWSYVDDNTTDGLNHVAVTNQAGWVTHQWTEPAFGNVVRSQDANGGYTHYKYDAGGLLLEGWAPAENGREADGNVADVPQVVATSTQAGVPTVPTVSYRYDVYGKALSVRTKPVVVVSADFAGHDGSAWRSLSQVGTVRRVYEFMDGFGRPVESHAVAPNGSGGRLITKTSYDNVGRVVRVSEPYLDATKSAQAANGLHNAAWSVVPRYSETLFDAYGQVASTWLRGTAISRQLSATSWGLGWVEQTASLTGAKTRTESDALGRVTRKVQYPESGKAGAAIITAYTYAVSAAGVTTTVTDAAGSQTVFVSDVGGRRVSMVDPNSGTSTYAYNAQGQVSQVVSAAGTVSMSYDVLGRLTSRTGKDAGGVVSSGASWVFDPVGHRGALASETATTVTPVGVFSVTSTSSYDALHRLVGSTVTLPVTGLLGELSGKSYTTGMGYDVTGAATTVTYPVMGGLPVQSVVTGVDGLGRARSLSVTDAVDARQVVTGTTFDGVGRMTGRTFGNGLTRTYGYDSVWGAVSSMSASYGSGAGVVQNSVYTRDGAGRVSQVRDLISDNVQLTQCYTYDGFNRLDFSWTDLRSSGQCTVSWALSPQPTGSDAAWGYDQGFQYSATGQVTLKRGIAVGTFEYYSYADEGHPYAVTQVVRGSGTDSFSYDVAGRMVSRDVGGVATDLFWDVSSRLVASSGQGGDMVYVYDGSGQRIAQISVGDLDAPTPIRATVYLGATEATDSDTGSGSVGDVVVSRYYTLGGALVAGVTVVTGGVPVWQLLLGDVQGSVSTAMELKPNVSVVTGFTSALSSHVVTRDGYLPFGGARGSEDISTDRGWLGQYEDTSTGLTYLNARYYDSVLGRFLSPDPLMDPGDPRTLDPYRYADNNPISFTDATGLTPKCGNDLDQVDRMTCYMSYGRTQVSDNRTREFLSTTIQILKDVSRQRALANVVVDLPVGARSVPDLRQQALGSLRGAAVLMSAAEAARAALNEGRWRDARNYRSSKTGGWQNFSNYVSGTDLLEKNVARDAIWNQGGMFYNDSGVCAELVMECILNTDFDYGTITLGHTVSSGLSLEKWEKNMASEALDVHEYAHVRQVERSGSMNFYLGYAALAPLGYIDDLLSGVKVPDLHDSNPYEKRADIYAGVYCRDTWLMECQAG